MKKIAGKHLDSRNVLFRLGDNQILVNVLQRVSSVILQKSTREGFGLTVSEAQWKETPVVASHVGGIPEQVLDGETGFLVDPQDIEGCAEKVVTLIKDKKLAAKMGREAKKYIKQKFLITRHLDDYLDLLIDVLKS